MPPRRNSRHLHTTAQQRLNLADLSKATLYLSDRVPFRYRDLPDNRMHTVREGDSLTRLAAKQYASLGRLPYISAANLWWVIADFQPIPIHDPTVLPVKGEKLIIPSLRTVVERVLQRQRNV